MSPSTPPVAAPQAPAVPARRVALFETPLMVAQPDRDGELRAALATVIAARRATHPGIARSNEGGWHSDTSMTQWGGAPARRLAEMAIGVARQMSNFEGAAQADFDWRASLWANVSPPGALHHLHAHPGNDWAAVFYVATGAIGDEAAGALYLEDPRFPISQMRTPALRMRGGDGKSQFSQIELKPRAGDLIVFPAWLRHGVRTHRGSGERISVAINIAIHPHIRARAETVEAPPVAITEENPE